MTHKQYVYTHNTHKYTICIHTHSTHKYTMKSNYEIQNRYIYNVFFSKLLEIIGNVLDYT